jgi:hypothetical protein
VHVGEDAEKRLARSVPDALDILSHLSGRGVRFALGSSVYDWQDPFARMFLQILAVVAEFEANLIRRWSGQCVGGTWHDSKAVYCALGRDCGRPNMGRTVFSKRVMAPIRSPARVRTKRPTPWMPVGVCR